MQLEKYSDHDCEKQHMSISQLKLRNLLKPLSVWLYDSVSLACSTQNEKRISINCLIRQDSDLNLSLLMWHTLWQMWQVCLCCLNMFSIQQISYQISGFIFMFMRYVRSRPGVIHSKNWVFTHHEATATQAWDQLQASWEHLSWPSSTDSTSLFRDVVPRNLRLEVPEKLPQG